MKKMLLTLALAGILACTSLAAASCGPHGSTGGTDDTDKEQPLPDDPDKEPDDPKPDPEPEERQLRVLPPDLAYEVQRSEYKIKYENIELYGELYEPTDAKGLLPVVIMSHGFNGHYTDFVSECTRLAERGYVAYAFDFCGAQANGKSTGRTAADYTPFTMKEDLCAVVNHFASLPIVDTTQIFLWGGSQGGLVTALAAADETIRDKISAVALYFPAFNIPDDWRGRPIQDTPLMGYSIGAKFIESVQDFDPFSVIGNYGGEVCIVWGDQDALVARKYIDGAVEAYQGRAQLTVLEGAGHGFIGKHLQTAIDTVLAFLEARTYEPPKAK